MIHRVTAVALLLGSVAFGLFAVADASAADVDKLVQECAECHGKDGASKETDVPTIGGVSAQYIIDSMTAYKNKERPCVETKYRTGDKKGKKTDMCKVAKDLSAEDVKGLANHFSGKKFVRATQKFDPALAKKGKEVHELYCEKCHSEGGSLPDDDAGILAGQHTTYLEHTFKQYEAGKRPQPKKMKPKMDKLNKSDVEALINYYGSFQ